MSALAYESSPAEVDRTLADVLSQFALPLGYDDIPATVRERAKHLILDSVGIALASTKYPFASVSLAALRRIGHRHISRHRRRPPPVPSRRRAHERDTRPRP